MSAGQWVNRRPRSAADAAPWLLCYSLSDDAIPCSGIAPLLPRAPWFLWQFVPLAPAALAN